jgi:hypothetical protein
MRMANSGRNMYCFKDFIKWQVLKTLLSVLNIDKPHKDGSKEKWKWNNDVRQDAYVQYYEPNGTDTLAIMLNSVSTYNLTFILVSCLVCS